MNNKTKILFNENLEVDQLLNIAYDILAADALTKFMSLLNNKGFNTSLSGKDLIHDVIEPCDNGNIVILRQYNCNCFDSKCRSELYVISSTRSLGHQELMDNLLERGLSPACKCLTFHGLYHYNIGEYKLCFA